MFTDAPAKDEARMNEVISAANAKNISVSSLLTDQCTRKRSIEKGLLNKPTFSVIIIMFCYYSL